MARESAIVFAAALMAVACLGAAERAMADDSSPVFATGAQAETYLRSALPQITAANPKYRSKQDSAMLTRWLTKSIAFDAAANGGVIVSTEETYDQYSGDASPKPNTHQAKFPIDDVTIAMESSEHDLTEAGEEAKGVMFRCKGAPCIDAVWNGAPSKGSWTDIYVEDAATRARVFAAFKALQNKPPGG